MEQPTLKQVLDRHRGRLLQMEGVIGIAVGLSGDDPAKHCIVVYARRDEPPAELPTELDGFPVELQAVAGFEARGEQEN
ncbi:MAG: hypothetical protein ACYTA3_00840 [Planctomycetota bacterium]|jgi:hypothetical protein